MADDFRVYFVIPDRDEENNSTLVEAFEALSKADFNFKPEWIKSEDCLAVDGKGKQIYICDPFEGPAFDHLKKLGYRVYGPRCILANLRHGMDLPKNKKYPIYNLAMKEVKICCTSLDRPSRDDIMEKVRLMAGDVDSNLTADVTHLIAGEVGSNKYLVAVEKGKSVMVKNWVYKVWEASLDKHILATDDVFEKYICPPFLGLTIVVSGFSSSERNHMRSFVTRGGGKYSGELNMNECTHLVVKEPKGAKYEAAQKWQIRIVRDRWLFDCMDKGRYLDPKPYQFDGGSDGKNAKTSTPERRSTIAPNISDISAITSTGLNMSARRVDETTDVTSRFSGHFNMTTKSAAISETKLNQTTAEGDTTVTSADVFLDGCRIYLSGLTPTMEERLKKIISVGGALRSMELNKETTHVVIGDVLASDVVTLDKLRQRMYMYCLWNILSHLCSPHLVTVEWLMDCLCQNTLLPEGKYHHDGMRQKLLFKTDGTRTEPEEPPKLTSQPSKVKGGSEKPEDDSIKTKAPDSQVFRAEAPSDLEMAELLSQYIEPQGAEDKEVHAGEKTEDTTIRAQEEAEGEAMTQDPNEMDESEGLDRGIFYKKSFVILGFDEDETAQLTEFVESKGGRVFSSKKSHEVADIAIVPLMGFPVDMTVSDVLTNAWLQMCIEADMFLPYDDYWLSRPIELPESEPLAGCCISVSGYVGVERECIMHLAQSLGANCQDHFARKSNKNIQASTHLIISNPSGPKYDAAKKWNIPAVGKEWIFACIEKEKKVPEEKYLIDFLEEKRVEVEQAQSKSGCSDSESRRASISSLPTPPRPSDSDEDKQRDGRMVSTNSTDTRETKGDKADEGEANGETPLSVAARQPRSKDETNKVREAVRPTEKESEDRIPTSSIESSGSSHKQAGEQNPMAEVQRHLKAVTPTANLNTDSMQAKKSACRPNQSENISAGGIKTPKDILRQKLCPPDASPASSSTPLGLIRGGGETPGTFMHPDFKPKFNLKGMFETPEPEMVDLNKSTPLGETFRKHISIAAQNAWTENTKSAGTMDGEMPASQSQPDILPPLHGVVIAVAKKLGRSHEQYNSIVVELGGNYSWQCGPQVTHFVFQGRPNDTNKEFRKARDEGKTIVSPYWLYACRDQNCRVDESSYPHSFNPSYSLTITPAATPSRSTRATVKHKAPPESLSKVTTANTGKTPAKKMPVLNLAQVPVKETSSATPQSTKGSTPTVSRDRAVKEHLLPTGSKASPAVSREAPQNVSSNTSLVGHNSSARETSTAEGGGTKESSSNRSRSQEMKEALSKTLGNVLAEASRSRRSNRNKMKRRNLSGQLNASEEETPQDSLARTASGWTPKGPKQDVPAPEPSQSLQVTWEDPTEKLEKEKLAHRLERMCQPSQNTEELMVAMDLPQTSAQTRTNTRSGSSFDRSPTPEPPSLVFPVAKPTSEVLPPQPVELLSDESNDSRTNTSTKPVPVFLISGMQNEEKVEYSALVEQLGGRMVEKQHFDPACTHLVVAQPARNEKFLSCVASGKWVLHKSYFEACRKEGKFVQEETHEWGSKFTLPLMQNMTSQANKLAAAAYKWRKKVAALKQIKPSCQGAFDGWKVLLCLDRSKEENFQRLLEAGGAKVSAIRPPIPNTVKATHAFVDFNKIKFEQEDLEKLIQAEIHCLKTEYIPAILTDDPVPDPSDFYPVEIVALKACMPEPHERRKRRRANGEDSQTNSSKTPRR